VKCAEEIVGKQLVEHDIGRHPGVITPEQLLPHDLLSTFHSDTLAAAVTRGSVIVGNATPAWSELVVGGADEALQSNGTDAAWGPPRLTYGEIYGVAASDTIAIGAAGKVNKVQITSFDTNGLSNNMTPDHTNDHITVLRAGVYLCVVSLHVETVGGGDPDTFGFSLFKNNGAVEFPNVHAHRQMAGGGGDVGSVGLSGMIALAVNDTIELWCWNEDDAEDIVIEDVTLNLLMIKD